MTDPNGTTEYEIIRTVSSGILSRFRNIVMELHPAPPGESRDALVEKLSDCGFREIPIGCAMAKLGSLQNLTNWFSIAFKYDLRLDESSCI